MKLKFKHQAYQAKAVEAVIDCFKGRQKAATVLPDGWDVRKLLGEHPSHPYNPNVANAFFRAGRYISQPAGYRAYIPATLPPNPPVGLEGEMYSLLSRADRALGRLDGSIQTLPHADLFVAMHVRKEAVLSSQIEGTQSSLRDVLAAEAQIYSPDLPKDVGEVFNYIRAMNYGLDRLKKLPVSVRLIREVHALLLEGAREGTANPGELRSSQNWIGPGGCALNEVVEVSQEATETARRILALRENHRQIITEQMDRTAGNGHRVLETLYVKPIISVADVKQETGTSYTAANQLVNRLVELGIIAECTGNKRNRRFMYRDYLGLFRED